MRTLVNLKRGQRGQTLIYVTMIVALSALIMGPLLQFTYAGHRSVRIREERMLELYAADSGIEDAMYQIRNEGDFDDIGAMGFGDTYNPDTPDGWNDRDMDVSIEKVWIPGGLGYSTPVVGTTDKSAELKMVGLYTFIEMAAAEDDFDETGWGGGTGWPAEWEATGSVVKGTDGDYTGDKYLKFSGGDGIAKRKTSLTDFYEPRLKFYANAGSFEPGDYADCLVSTVEDPGAGDWDTLLTWEYGNDTGEYLPVDVDISAYANSTDFWIAYETDMIVSEGSLAQDDFETGDECGGPGWDAPCWTLYNSYYSDYTNVILDGGNYHLRVKGRYGDARRKVSVPEGCNDLRLQCYAKRTDNWETDDKAYVRIQINGVGDWYYAATLTKGILETSYKAFDIDLSTWVTSTPASVEIRFDTGMDSSYEHFYVDDIEITGSSGGHFYVDDLWIGNDVDAYTIEVAYTTDVLGHAWLETLGAWLPPGWQYIGVVNEDWDMPEATAFEPPPPTNSFAGGTILEWDFYGKNVDLQQPLGARPVVRSMTFRFIGGGETEGIFTWIKATEYADGTGNEYLSWDTGYEIYRAVSVANHEIWGSSTTVEAYTAQGETDKRGLIAYGNYQATGSPLLIDATLDTYQIKEKLIDPTNPDTWTTVNGVTYTGRADINSIPDDAEVVAAWLYWSAFLDGEEYSGGDWWDPPPGQEHASGEPDKAVEFMYPKVYGPESFAVVDGDESYTVDAYTTYNEPIVQEPRDVFVYLNPYRYVDESLGEAYNDNGNETFTTVHKPILQSPAPIVVVNSAVRTEGEDYTIDYNKGEITIINESLQGTVSIDYSVTGLRELVKDTDYTVDYENGLITLTNEYLVGTAYVYYWAQHWDTGVSHNAVDRYGTELDPAVKFYQAPTYPYTVWGWFYSCFADVTGELTGLEMYVPLQPDYAVPTGKGEYAVTGIDSTNVPDSQNNPGQACYSGWSLIVLYESPSETAHQFYLYDPIHNPYDPGTNPDGCPFFSGQNSNINFTLTNFYPPAGAVDGKMTYFVGEGDDAIEGDYVQFEGEYLDDPNPADPNYDTDDLMNARSTNGERGIDIDTFPVLDYIGSDNEADVLLHTNSDGWTLCYIILSFKTEMVPKQDYFFNVAAVTYSYEVGAAGQ